MIPDFLYKPGVHVHYQETVLPMRDGVPKIKDLPKEMGRQRRRARRMSHGRVARFRAVPRDRMDAIASIYRVERIYRLAFIEHPLYLTCIVRGTGPRAGMSSSGDQLNELYHQHQNQAIQNDGVPQRQVRGSVRRRFEG
jgi:hypothetical protein